MTPVQYAAKKDWEASCTQYALFDEDLIIYLHCPVKVALQRIKARARELEKTSCTVERLLTLEQRYKETILEPHKRVLFVDTERPFHWGFKDFCEKIQDHFSEYQHDADDDLSRVCRGDLRMSRSVFQPATPKSSSQPENLETTPRNEARTDQYY